jgi:hypothetical protein
MANAASNVFANVHDHFNPEEAAHAAVDYVSSKQLSAQRGMECETDPVLQAWTIFLAK